MNNKLTLTLGALGISALILGGTATSAFAVDESMRRDVAPASTNCAEDVETNCSSTVEGNLGEPTGEPEYTSDAVVIDTVEELQEEEEVEPVMWPVYLSLGALGATILFIIIINLATHSKKR